MPSKAPASRCVAAPSGLVVVALRPCDTKQTKLVKPPTLAPKTAPSRHQCALRDPTGARHRRGWQGDAVFRGPSEDHARGRAGRAAAATPRRRPARLFARAMRLGRSRSRRRPRRAFTVFFFLYQTRPAGANRCAASPKLTHAKPPRATSSPHAAQPGRARLAFEELEAPRQTAPTARLHPPLDLEVRPV